MSVLDPWPPSPTLGSELHAGIERRKRLYEECVVRNAHLSRAGFDAPLYADIDADSALCEDAKAERRQKRSDHLRDGTVRRDSKCEVMAYRPVRSHAPDLIGMDDAIARYEAMAATDPDGRAPQWDGLAYQPPLPTDGKVKALARLAIAQRHPGRRRRLFPWNDGAPDATTQRRGYWTAVVAESLDHLRLQWDTADFHANDLLRLVYLHGEVPTHLQAEARAWRPADRMARDADLDGTVEARILDALRSFKYWLDETPQAVDCERLVAARVAHEKRPPDPLPEGWRPPKIDDADHRYEMTYWSENHQILFPAAEYLAGQWMPAGAFLPAREFREPVPEPTAADFDGTARMSRARPRILRWLDDRLRFGFSEWNAPGYYKEHLQALLNLADFCVDDEIRRKTHCVIDLLFFDLARLSRQGPFGASAGRAYFEHKNCGWGQGVCDLIQIAFDSHEGVFAGEDPAAIMFTTSTGYRLPDAIVAIGQDRTTQCHERARVSIGFDDAPSVGIGTTTDDDVLRWWSRAGWFCHPVIDRSRALAEQHGLMKTEPFSKILPLTGIVDDSALAWTLAGLSLLVPTVGLPLLGALAVIDEDELADAASVMTEGSALTRANLRAWSDGNVTLSSVQDFRAGQFNFQTQVCQATLSMNATVWTTHPCAGADLSGFQTLFEVLGAGAGGIGGFALGAALGSLLAPVLPVAPLVGAVLGAKEGGELGHDVGESLGETTILPVTHDGPTWWTGTVTLPSVVQFRDAAIIGYDPNLFQRVLFGARTHAWFPKAAFDADADVDDWDGLEPRPGLRPEPMTGARMPVVDTSVRTPLIPSLTPLPSANSNVETGAWIFGRVGDGYVALYSAQPIRWTTEGDWADRELLADGARNVFILQVGSRETFGSYLEFKRRVLAARIHVHGVHWDLADLQCSYDLPGGSRLELHHSDRDFRYAGVGLDTNWFPRYDTPWAQVRWQQRRYVIQHGHHSLLHDRVDGRRLEGPPVRELRHDTDFRIHVQNTGLFPSAVGLLYKGAERRLAVATLIRALRDDGHDVVGLTEMWSSSERDDIAAAVHDVYPHVASGPGGSLTNVFDGGLMLLSRHPIVATDELVFDQAVGEDLQAEKGVLHVRLRPDGWPCELDVFLTHTQGPAPVLGDDDVARRVIRRQVAALADFVRGARDPHAPAVLMGDFNVNAYDPREYGHLLAALGGRSANAELFRDLAPTVDGASGRGAVRPDATSESEASRISSFPRGNDARTLGAPERFGPAAERIDYLFAWDGIGHACEYPEADRRVVLRQTSAGRDFSDHYGLTVRLASIVQSLPRPDERATVVGARLVRFRCLETTSGPGDDEVQFELRLVAADGREQSARTAEIGDVDDGDEASIAGLRVEVAEPGEFVIVAVSGREVDDLSADEALGPAALWMRQRDLAVLRGTTIQRALLVRGHGGRYVVDVEVDVT